MTFKENNTGKTSKSLTQKNAKRYNKGIKLLVFRGNNKANQTKPNQTKKILT